MLTLFGVMAALSPPPALYSLPEVPSSRSPKLGGPGDRVNGAGSDQVFHGIVVLQGPRLAEIFKIPHTGHVKGLRRGGRGRQHHALLVKGHHAGVVAVRKRGSSPRAACLKRLPGNSDR